MANATTAPLKKDDLVEIGGFKLKKDSKEYEALTQEFETDIKYMFELAELNPEREKPVIDARNNRVEPHKKFKPFQNIVLSSQIVWNGQRVNIRYYDGCDSIFVAQQPKDKDVVEQLIRQTQQRNFLEGKFGVYGDEGMLLLYLNICSWNGSSPFRTRTANAIFMPVDTGKKAIAESEKLDQIEEALKLAREAKKTKMLIHADYLGIPVIDYDSGNELTEKEIRTEYRKAASRNAAAFIESYGNKGLETKFYINKALQKGIITNTFNPNQATWATSNRLICDISGLKSHDAISQRLFEFASTEEGEEFLIQLKAVSE